MNSRLIDLALAALVVLPAGSAAAADIVINNVDAPGVGFNDPTPAAPVGGNPATTVGGQRLATFQHAAALWGAVLPSEVDIVIQGTFQPLFCDAGSAVLGAAGTIQIFTMPPGTASWPLTWYPAALANKLVGTDLTPGPPDPGLLAPPYADDIVAFFNGALAGNASCLGGASWYYGFDNQPGPNQIDLLNVLMHEFGHGLGFASFVDDASGAGPLGLPDIYSAFLYDNTLAKYWNQTTNKERKVSVPNTGNVVWHGPTVTERAPEVLSGLMVMRVTAPMDIAGDYELVPASYGAPLTEAGVTGGVVLYNDGVGPDPNDGCDAFDPNVAGKIALINRGTCPFALKSALAQLSGAIGVIVTNNQPTGFPGMGGADLVPPMVPSVGITKADGDLIKSRLPGVTLTLRTDQALGLAGADQAGFVRVYAPNPIEPGSSISHWDTTATPNLLMEPFLNADLKAATDLDLTPDLLADIGWDGDVHCPVGSDLDSPTVVVDGCDTMLPNFVGPFTFPLLPLTKKGLTSGDVVSGCTLSDLFNGCIGISNAGDKLACVTRITNVLTGIGFISGAYAGAIQACVAP